MSGSATCSLDPPVVSVGEWDVDAILSGPRLRTRRSHAALPAGRVVEAGFGLLATFGAPHCSVIHPSYTASRRRSLSVPSWQEAARRLREAMGVPHRPPQAFAVITRGQLGDHSGDRGHAGGGRVRAAGCLRRTAAGSQGNPPSASMRFGGRAGERLGKRHPVVIGRGTAK